MLHGGTGFYTKSGLVYKVRKDLTLSSPGNFEIMFIEIIIPDRKNLLVGCVYRHGSGIKIREFTNDHLEPIFDKISNENKDCTLMGDFNVNLLQSNGNNFTCEYHNMFSLLFHSFDFATNQTWI